MIQLHIFAYHVPKNYYRDRAVKYLMPLKALNTICYKQNKILLRKITPRCRNSHWSNSCFHRHIILYAYGCFSFFRESSPWRYITHCNTFVGHIVNLFERVEYVKFEKYNKPTRSTCENIYVATTGRLIVQLVEHRFVPSANIKLLHSWNHTPVSDDKDL